ncbi:MAG TPA: hypothetical protein VFZ42_05375 [Chitinophagaceae bacterium]
MVRYKKYLIKSHDQFDPEKFPFLADDIASIMAQTSTISPLFRNDIIISFLKDNFIKPEWKQGNPELTSLIESGSLPTENLQSLFDSGRNNTLYSQEYEGFLKKNLGER